MRSQSSQRTHSDFTIRGPWIAPHSHAFSQIRHVLHSDHRLIGRSVATVEIRPRVAPTGHANRQYILRTKTVARRSVPSPNHITVFSDSPNIQNGSTKRYTIVLRVAM